MSMMSESSYDSSTEGGHEVPEVTKARTVNIPPVVDPHRALIERLGRKWLTVEPITVLNTVAYLSLNPLTQQYVYQRMEEAYNISTSMNTTENCTLHTDTLNATGTADFHAAVSRFTIMQMLFFLFPSVIVMSLLVPYSDHKGRKVALLPPVIFTLTHSVAVLLTILFRLPLEVILISIFVAGLSGGVGCSNAVAFSYIADITPSHKRLLRIVIIEIGHGIFSFLVNLLVGILIPKFGFMVACCFFVGMNMFVLAYTIWLPETVRKTQESRGCVKPRLAEMPKLFLLSQERAKLIISSCIMFTIGIVDAGPISMLAYYLLDPPLCWHAFYIGLYQGVTSIVKSFGSLVIMKLLVGRIVDPLVMLIGCVSATLYCIFMAGAKHTSIPFVAAAVSVASMIVMPVIRSFNSKIVAQDVQGALFSGLGVAQMMSALLGAILFNTIYSATAETRHGIVFIVAACFTLIPILLSIVLTIMVLRERKLSMLTDTLINDSLVSDSASINST